MTIIYKVDLNKISNDILIIKSENYDYDKDTIFYTFYPVISQKIKQDDVKNILDDEIISFVINFEDIKKRKTQILKKIKKIKKIKKNKKSSDA